MLRTPLISLDAAEFQSGYRLPELFMPKSDLYELHVAHLVVRPIEHRPCPKSRLRDGGEWGRKGRLKAGSGLCELRSSSRWPPWRRCFGFRGDGCDALLVALKFMGAVEAGALMVS